ncbi:MAG TPA: hypothetical protein VKX49_01495 [Bryobacteraceae bacterium]|nr:hypothetical protein [Bryobacteraceae bacterium]
MRYLLLLVSAGALFAASQMSLTVEKLKAFIQSTIQLKQPDAQVAQYLRQVKLTERLEDATVEELQSQGAGPKTVAALRAMVDATANLPQPAPAAPKVVYVPPPAPSSAEQEKILSETRDYVMNYTKNLPNFICVQVTRRFIDPSGKGTAFHNTDTITAKLTYDGQHEDYDIVLKNNQPVTNVKMEQLGGTTSSGEFGTMMKEIFDPESHAKFEWDHWATLRGRRAYVFAYEIAQEFSKYHVEETDTKQELVPAYRGLVYIDRDTNMVTKVTLNPYNVPPDFPIQEIHVSLDYDFAKIADATYLLPLKAVLTSRAARVATKNEIEFRLYRKFETGSTIKFDTPEPLSDDQTQEKPAQDSKTKK